MNTTIKSREYAQINKNLELLSTKVILQFDLAEKLLVNRWEEDIHKQIIENEKIIDTLDTQIIHELTDLVILFSPKAAELRKITSCIEVVVFLEQIGDFLLDIIQLTKEVDLHSSDYIDFKNTLRKMVIATGELVSTTAYSFFKDISREAFRVLRKDDNMEELSKEISENLITSFQEIDLTGQELLNIINLNNISYIFKRIKDNAINIAKATIFATEGVDVSHQNLKHINSIRDVFLLHEYP